MEHDYWSLVWSLVEKGCGAVTTLSNILATLMFKIHTNNMKMTPGRNAFPSNNDSGRREFLSRITKAAGSAMLLSSPVGTFYFTRVNESWTVGQIMDLFINEVPGGPIKETVDTLK